MLMVSAKWNIEERAIATSLKMIGCSAGGLVATGVLAFKGQLEGGESYKMVYMYSGLFSILIGFISFCLMNENHE